MSFTASREIKEYTMTIPASCEEVFPLLCPKREYDWLPYWSCNIIYSQSGKAEPGCVFQTDFPDRGNMTWMVTKYDPPKEIQYTVFKPESHVWNLEICLEPIEPTMTHILWRHTYTGLTEEGNRFLSEHTDEKHRLHLGFIERALIHFLKTGHIIED